MLNLYPDFYHKFRCLASACPDNCCVGWEVVVDDDTARFYDTVPGDLGRQLRSAMTTDEDGDRIIRMEEGHCPFWTKNHLCRVELELGHDAPCATCRKFPRLTQDYGVFTEYGLTLACPEAARLILTHHGPWQVETEGTLGDPGETDLDWAFLRELAEARETLLKELWQEDVPERQALARCLLHGRQFQQRFDGFDPEPLPPELPPEGDPRPLLHAHLELEILTEDWRLLLEEALAYTGPLPSLPETGMARNLAADYLYRYWFRAVNDWDCVLRLQLLAVNWAVARHLARVHLALHGSLSQNTLLRLFQLYAKEVEHDDVNRESLEELLLTQEIFSLEALLSLI